MNIAALLMMTAAAAPVAQREVSAAAMLDQAAQAFERRAQALANCRIVYHASEVVPLEQGRFDLKPMVQVEAAYAGAKSRQRTLHFEPRWMTPSEAEKFDPKLNTIVNDGRTMIHFNERNRIISINHADAKPKKLLLLTGYVELLFATVFRDAEHMRRPLIIRSGPMTYACLNSDVWLPEALRQPGWSVDEVPATDVADAPAGWSAGAATLLRLTRSPCAGVDDRIYLDTGRGHALVHRRLQFGAKDWLAIFYGDLEESTEGVWLPKFCQWQRGAQNFLLDEVVKLDIGGVTEKDFDLEYPYGAMIHDYRSGVKTVKPGGQELLVETKWLIARMHPDLQRPFGVACLLRPYESYLAALAGALAVGLVCGLQSWRRNRRARGKEA